MRGADFYFAGSPKSGKIEVIEELNPCCDIVTSVKVPEKVVKVTLEPQGREVSFTVENGCVRILIDCFACHQMVVLHY